MGKSRLLKDYLDSKGAYTLFEGRPGAGGVPYSTQSRILRQVLNHYQVNLAPWQRKEISRLLPELGETPEPLTSEIDELRFYEAQAAVFQTAFETGMKVIAVDDLHFFDDPSFKALNFILGKYWVKPNTLPSVLSYRSNALSDSTEGLLNQTLQGRSSLILDLTHFDQSQVQTLIDSLGIANLEPLQNTLNSYTGGNPLFMLETIKSVLESRSQTLKRPNSSKVQTLLQQRLGKLSQGAIRLAWTAAIAQTDFSLELASHITQQAPFDLAEVLNELEDRNIFIGQRFSHDLMFEASLASLSELAKLYLHKQTAEFLEKQKADPARIANYYLEAKLEIKATPFLLQAARQQRANFRFIEAIGLFVSAVNILEKHGDMVAVFETLYE